MVNTPIETLARKIRRWEEDPGAEPSVMAQIGRRLLAGETLGAEVAPDYGVSGGTVSMVIRDMRKVGYRFRTQPGLTGGNSKVFTLTARPPFDFDLAPTPPAGPSSAPQPTPYRGPDSFTRAGWLPPSERVEDGGRVYERIRPGSSRREPPPREVVTLWEYPPLGATLEVRALALTDEGVLVQMVGGGGAWQATITGHVAPQE